MIRPEKLVFWNNCETKQVGKVGLPQGVSKSRIVETYHPDLQILELTPSVYQQFLKVACYTFLFWMSPAQYKTLGTHIHDIQLQKCRSGCTWNMAFAWSVCWLTLIAISACSCSGFHGFVEVILIFALLLAVKRNSHNQRPNLYICAFLHFKYLFKLLTIRSSCFDLVTFCFSTRCSHVGEGLSALRHVLHISYPRSMTRM